MAIETANGKVFYPELGKAADGVTDREAIRAILAAAPVGAFLVVIAGWAIGSFFGGWTAGCVARHAPVRRALELGGLLTVAGVANNLMIPPPGWFWVPSLIVFLPAAYAGGRLVRKV
jgi:hypothetical protein